jgi:hypothetical protein
MKEKTKKRAKIAWIIFEMCFIMLSVLFTMFLPMMSGVLWFINSYSQSMYVYLVLFVFMTFGSLFISFFICFHISFYLFSKFYIMKELEEIL